MRVVSGPWPPNQMSRDSSKPNRGSNVAMPTNDRPKLLMVTHRLPHPPVRGDRIRTWHMLRQLQQRFDVHLACVADEPPTLNSWRAIQRHVADLEFEPVTPLVRRGRALRHLAAGKSITSAWFQSPRLRQTIERWVRREKFDVALAVCAASAPYLAGLPIPSRVIDLMDVDSRKWAELANTARGPRRAIYNYEADALAREEAALAHQFDALTVTTDAEAHAYRQLVPWADVHVVPNGVDLDYFASNDQCDRCTVAFCGALNYRPNVEGLLWFTRSIWPRIKAGRPDARFRIVGRRPDRAVRRLRHLPGVELIGQVADVRPHLQNAAVVVAPLQVARGVQNKVLEAMAMARPTVVSPAAATGIDAVDAEHWHVAPSPDAWVRRVAELLDDPAAQRRIGAAARSFVASDHQWSDAMSPLLDLLAPRDITTPTESADRPPLRLAA
ncbi:MAG: sugar transferase [Planctomycetaceae bacterium]|nr:sugar transferase [Planctomycetaceae bacterium]